MSNIGSDLECNKSRYATDPKMCQADGLSIFQRAGSSLPSSCKSQPVGVLLGSHVFANFAERSDESS